LRDYVKMRAEEW